MRQVCSECGGAVYIIRSGQMHGRGCLPDHSLCGRCYRALRDRTVAARMEPKPFWAIRDSLTVLAEQAAGRARI